MKIINNDLVIVEESLPLYTIDNLHTDLFFVINYSEIPKHGKIIAAYKDRRDAVQCMYEINNAILRGDKTFYVPRYEWVIRAGDN